MKEIEHRPFLGWPGWRHLAGASLLSFFVTTLFCLVFVGADWFTAHHAARVRVHLDAELHFPLVPCFTLVYMSIYVLFFAVPFVLRTQHELKSLALAQAMTILIAGVSFLLIPAQLGYPPATDSELGVWKPLFVFADDLNLDYNLVPSLHVALSIVCVEMFRPYAGGLGKVLLRLWGILIATSTLLTHQHHFLDVVTGYLLALAMVKLVDRMIGPDRASSIIQHSINTDELSPQGRTIRFQ